MKKILILVVIISFFIGFITCNAIINKETTTIYHVYVEEQYKINNITWNNSGYPVQLQDIQPLNEENLLTVADQWLKYQNSKLTTDSEIEALHRHGAMTWISYFFFNMTIEEHLGEVI